jgi:hypothetical protein
MSGSLSPLMSATVMPAGFDPAPPAAVFTAFAKVPFGAP